MRSNDSVTSKKYSDKRCKCFQLPQSCRLPVSTRYPPYGITPPAIIGVWPSISPLYFGYSIGSVNLVPKVLIARVRRIWSRFSLAAFHQNMSEWALAVGFVHQDTEYVFAPSVIRMMNFHRLTAGHSSVQGGRCNSAFGTSLPRRDLS